MTDFGKILNSHTVVFERVLPGPIERVWEAITSPSGIASWLFADSNFEVHQGGRIDLKFGNPDPQTGHQWHVRGTVSECVPTRVIAYSWMETSTDLSSHVRFALEPRGNEVLLVVTHSYLGPDFMPKVGAGWHAHLDTLVSILRGETPADYVPIYVDLLVKYTEIAAAALILSSAVSPALAQSNDPAYKAVNAQRQELLNKYDRVWKEADQLKFQIDIVARASNEDVSRTRQDLERELKYKYDDLRRVELDIRDLDKTLI